MTDILVKICGIRNTATMEQLAGLDMDYIGFVFAKSKRQVTAEQAAEMIDAGRRIFGKDAPGFVGVFVNPELPELERIMALAKLDVIQLHGTESPDLCGRIQAAFSAQVWKVMSVAEQSKLGLEQLEPYTGKIDALLLDTYDPVYGGGSGQTFNWSVIPEYQLWAERHSIPMLVAGGLNADNVHELCSLYRPHGVDVSSGVETDGAKDIDKIKAFIGRVKSYV